MPVVKANTDTEFTIVPNRTAQDLRIQADSLGILIDILSRDSNWILYKDKIGKDRGYGRERIDRIFKELQACHYLVKLPYRVEGRFYKDYWIAFADCKTGKKYADDPEGLIDFLETTLPGKIWDSKTRKKVMNPYLTCATPDVQPRTGKPSTGRITVYG